MNTDSNINQEGLLEEIRYAVNKLLVSDHIIMPLKYSVEKREPGEGEKMRYHLGILCGIAIPEDSD